MSTEDKLKEELHSWSRHYDTLLWTVTGIFSGANSGLLLYAYDSKSDVLGVYILGIILTFITVYFARSFRANRESVHDLLAAIKSKEESEEETGERKKALEGLVSSPGYEQWPIFVLFFIILNTLWIVQGLEIYPVKYKYLLLIISHVINIEAILFIAYFKPKKGEQDMERKFIDATFTFAGIALKPTILINGGAAIAVLAFLGLFGPGEYPQELSIALLVYAIGVLSAAISAGLSYLCQYFYAKTQETRGNSYRIFAVILIIISYASFAYASYTAFIGFN